MKTPLEFLASIGSFDFSQLARSAIELRDAGHAAESKAREEAMQAQIELLSEHCNDRNALVQERDRLKGELAEARRLENEACVAHLRRTAPYYPAARRAILELASVLEARILAAPSPAESTGVPCSGTCWPPCAQHAKQIAAETPAAQPVSTVKAESTGVPPLVVDAYPCNECGVTRTKAEGGTVFTVCDTCWDARSHCACKTDEPAASPDDIRERVVYATQAQLDMRMRVAGERQDEFERRLKALEERYDVLSKWNGALAKMAEGPAAPQEQAGHAWECAVKKPGVSTPCFDYCECKHCGKRLKDCTGAKP